MSTQEATVNPDGSTTFTTPPEADASSGGFDDTTTNSGEFFNATDGDAEDAFVGAKETDPALYVGLAFLFVVVIVIFVVMKRRKQEDEFFNQLDGEKFNLKLPAAVDEYYQIKDKCMDQGWEPGQKAEGPEGSATGPHRVLAQALMKRCIADIPLVTHIQKESAGMNKLYSHSMCSVKQWRSYQAAEQMVSNEVDEVRAEADEIEPGWSQVIWRQAMQYHNMLKQRHEMEAKAMAAQAEKKKAEENKVLMEKRREEEKRAKELAAEKAAAELIKAEEREKESKSAFAKSGSMKKGFLTSKPKK
jgi:flagellar biosynthesis GTPase FlhF